MNSTSQQLYREKCLDAALAPQAVQGSLRLRSELALSLSKGQALRLRGCFAFAKQPTPFRMTVVESYSTTRFTILPGT
jgi:hypothetical protein